MEGEIELDLDPLELGDVLRRFRQGDVLDVARMTWLFSPDHPLNPAEAAVDVGEPVSMQGRLAASGLAVIVSQTCDIWRLPDVEPFITLCPVIELDQDRYNDAGLKLSVRYFAYPPIPGHEDKERPAVDGRLFFSLEKPALLSDHIGHTKCPLSDPARTDLRTFLGQRLGRPDLPDEIIENLVGPIEQGFKRVHGDEAFGDFFSAVIFYGVTWTPGASGASVLVLTSVSKRRGGGVSDDDVRAAKKRLSKSLGHWLRGSPYEPVLSVHDADQVSAIDLLRHIELRLDLEGADVGE